MKKQIVATAIALSVLGGVGITSANASTIKMFKEPPFEAYKVDKGDTFYFIAKRYGLDYKALMKLNPTVDPYNMRVGSIIRLKPENTTAPTGSGTSAATGAAGSTSVSEYAKQVVNLVNQERSKAGLKPLTINNTLTKSAQAKAQDMHDKKYFDHTSPTYGSPFQEMTTFGYKYSYAGENIAQGQKTPSEVMTAWMNSQGHRENILNPNFTEIGVGYVSDNSYWVQQFGKPQ
ncbi:CAP domain-containing protein [Priestia aryabhattai]|uniref:CAP domain-containing protein n=1 Tax=Priestia aryabhattai TaxID=412384 RepID=UPI003D28BCDB